MAMFVKYFILIAIMFFAIEQYLNHLLKVQVVENYSASLIWYVHCHLLRVPQSKLVVLEPIHI